MGKVVLIILFLAVAGLAFGGGAIYQYYLKDKPIIENYTDYLSNPIDIDIEQAIIWLDRAAASHQPRLENNDPNDDEFHQGCIDRYASIKALLLKVNGSKME